MLQHMDFLYKFSIPRLLYRRESAFNPYPSTRTLDDWPVPVDSFSQRDHGMRFPATGHSKGIHERIAGSRWGRGPGDELPLANEGKRSTN